MTVKFLISSISQTEPLVHLIISALLSKLLTIGMFLLLCDNFQYFSTKVNVVLTQRIVNEVILMSNLNTHVYDLKILLQIILKIQVYSNSLVFVTFPLLTFFPPTQISACSKDFYFQ